MAEDLGSLVGAIGAAGIDTNSAIFVAGPREAMLISIKVGSGLFDTRVLMTLGLPPKTIACFAPAGIVSGWQDAPAIETGKESVIHFESAAPADIVAGGVAASPARSMFQTDVISIRVRANAAWAAVAGAAQFISTVEW